MGPVVIRVSPDPHPLGRIPWQRPQSDRTGEQLIPSELSLCGRIVFQDDPGIVYGLLNVSESVKLQGCHPGELVLRYRVVDLELERIRRYFLRRIA